MVAMQLPRAFSKSITQTCNLLFHRTSPILEFEVLTNSHTSMLLVLQVSLRFRRGLPRNLPRIKIAAFVVLGVPACSSLRLPCSFSSTTTERPDK